MRIDVIDADAGDDETTDRPWRRHGACLLLTIAVLAVLCVPGLHGRRTIGVAAAAPPADPPASGQCRAPLEHPHELDRMVGTALVPCDSEHSAEIVLVGPLPDDAEYPLSRSAAVLAAPAEQCDDAIRRFVGVPSTDRVGHAEPRVRSLVTVPTRHQWSSGQRWYSCQVLPADTTVPVAYTGTVAGAATGELSAEFAHCAQVIGGEPVPCTEPHFAEKFSASVESASKDLDCAAIGRRLMDTADPGYGGLLSLTSWQERHQLVACWATSKDGRPWIGTLVGRGDVPLHQD